VKAIIAGSRSARKCHVDAAIAACEWRDEINEVVSGCAQGADKYGESWAESLNIPISRFPPNWANGKSAGIIRNLAMAAYSDALIAVWDGNSRGTQHMITAAKARGLKVFVHKFNQKLTL